MTIRRADLHKLSRRGVQKLPNVHPGEILWADFMEPLGVTKNGLATAVGVPATRIGQIVRGTRSISADTDLRLSVYFGTTPGYWLSLQNAYDLEEASLYIDFSEIAHYAA